MDGPTYVITAAITVSLAVILLLKLFRVPESRTLGIQLAAISTVWALITLGGEFLFGWAGNATCSKYLGCVEGFAGYDAFEHTFFGIAGALAIMWLAKRYPKRSILPSSRWKAALIIIALIALIAVCWEILEFMHDTVELDILHLHLLNWRLHINNLDQPTNSDTMGDLTFALMGSVIGLLLRVRDIVIF